MKSECDTFMRRIFHLLLKYSTFISDCIKKKEMGEPTNLCCAAGVNTYECTEHSLIERENSPKMSSQVEKSYAIIQESFI